MERICYGCVHWRGVQWDSNEKIFKDEIAPCLRHDREKRRRDETCQDYFDSTMLSSSAPSVTTVAPVVIPTTVGGGKIKPLYEHQSSAVERFKDNPVIPLFFEAGCGKSATILRIVEHLYHSKKISSVLIIAPNKVHTQWFREQVPMWLADVRYSCQIFGGAGGKKIIRPFTEGVLNILVTNIDTFSTPEKWKAIVDQFKGEKYFIVLDEATAIKNVNAKRTKRVLYAFNSVKKRGNAILSNSVQSVGRAILTGTPITNSIIDLWSMMEFVKPNYWGRNFYAFQNRYGMFYELYTDHGKIKVPITEEIWDGIHRCSDYNEAHHLFGITEDTYRVVREQDHYSGSFKHVDEIKQKLSEEASFVRLVDCVDMPAQNYIRRIVELGEDQAKAYTDLENTMIAEYGGGECAVSSKLTLYLRLQQCSSGFLPFQKQVDQQVFDFDTIDYTEPEVQWFEDVPKLNQLYEDLTGCSKPAIIITRFTCEASRIYDDLVEKGYKVCLQTGWKTVGTIADYQAGKYEIMVANIRVISKGFNLQNGHTMFYYSNTFSLEDRLQSEGRIFRIGQQNPCQYFDYVGENTIDMKIVACLRQRRELMDYIRGVSLTSFLTEWDGVAEEEYADVYGSRL